MSQSANTSENRAVDLLRGAELFEGLSEEVLAGVADLTEERSYEDGEIIFEQDETGDALYVVVDAAVELFVAHEEGDQEKLAVKRPGEAFGEMSLLDDAPRSASARASGATELLMLAQDDFREVLGDDPLPRQIMAFLSKALRALDKRLAATEKLRGRVGAKTADPDEVSRVVQRGLLPRTAPRVSGYDVAAGTTTEEHGRGDTVWDWVELPSGATALAAFDVQGEGLPPSHHLVSARVLFRHLFAEYSVAAEVLPRANSAMTQAQIVGADQFVECGVVVVHEDAIEWTSAGRVPAGVIRRSGTFEELGSHGPPLGMMEGFRYSGKKVEMGPGDVFVVLSQASMGLFRGAADLVAQVQGKTAGEVVQTLHKAIRKAHDGKEPPETSVLFVRKH